MFTLTAPHVNAKPCPFCGIGATNTNPVSAANVTALERWGAAFFDRLTDWQTAHFPYLYAKRYGGKDAVNRIAAACAKEDGGRDA